MPVFQNAKALSLATRTSAGVANLMQALYYLVDIERERSSEGLTLANFDTALAADTRTQHATGVDYQSALTSAVAVKTFAEANFHTTNFDKVRP